MEIRQIIEEDITSLIEVCEACEHLVSERTSIYWLFTRFFANTSFLAQTDNKTVGIVLGFLSQSKPIYGYIHLLGVIPEYQGRGIGRALVDHFESTVTELGATTVYLTTLPENEQAIQFYEHIGFSPPRLFQKAGAERVEFYRETRQDMARR